MVPAKAFDVAQVEKAQPKPPVAIGAGEPNQPFGDERVFRLRLGLIPVAGLADLERGAGVPDADRLVGDCPSGHLSALRRPHHFFDRASLSRSALI